MPFIILGLLLVIAVILYLTFANKEGDPSLKAKPLTDLVDQFFQTPNRTMNSNEGDRNESKPEQEKPQTGSGSTGTENVAKAADGVDDKKTEQEKAFQSMEELTEFYRREAEKLTGIKH